MVSTFTIVGHKITHWLGLGVGDLYEGGEIEGTVRQHSFVGGYWRRLLSVQCWYRFSANTANFPFGLSGSFEVQPMDQKSKTFRFELIAANILCRAANVLNRTTFFSFFSIPEHMSTIWGFPGRRPPTATDGSGRKICVKTSNGGAPLMIVFPELWKVSFAANYPFIVSFWVFQPWLKKKVLGPTPIMCVMCFKGFRLWEGVKSCEFDTRKLNYNLFKCSKIMF